MDTLHPSKKRRVNRMGGVGVWRERERERGEWRRGQAVEESGCGLGDEEDGRERWEYDFDGDCLEDEMQSGKSAETYRDDDTFTMDMMLKSLGVDLNLIGYSKERQEWVG